VARSRLSLSGSSFIVRCVVSATVTDLKPLDDPAPKRGVSLSVGRTSFNRPRLMTYPLRRRACATGRPTRKYFKTKAPSRPRSGASQLRQAISQSPMRGSNSTRTTLYSALQFGQSNRVGGSHIIVGVIVALVRRKASTVTINPDDQNRNCGFPNELFSQPEQT
jgi:hypothetical protein